MNPDAVAPTGQPAQESGPSHTAGSSQPPGSLEAPRSTVPPAQAPTPEAISSASASSGQTTPHVVERAPIRPLASSEPSPLSSGLATPTEPSHHHHHHHLKSLRPLVHAVMAFEKSRKFSTGTSVHRKRQMSTLVEKEGHFGPALTVRSSAWFRPSIAMMFGTITCCRERAVFSVLSSILHLKRQRNAKLSCITAEATAAGCPTSSCSACPVR